MFQIGLFKVRASLLYRAWVVTVPLYVLINIPRPSLINYVEMKVKLIVFSNLRKKNLRKSLE